MTQKGRPIIWLGNLPFWRFITTFMSFNLALCTDNGEYLNAFTCTLDQNLGSGFDYMTAGGIRLSIH